MRAVFFRDAAEAAGHSRITMDIDNLQAFQKQIWPSFPLRNGHIDNDKIQ